MSNESELLAWVNRQCGGKEREQRGVMQTRITIALGDLAGLGATAAAREIALAVADYTAYAVAGSVWERGKD